MTDLGAEEMNNEAFSTSEKRGASEQQVDQWVQEAEDGYEVEQLQSQSTSAQVTPYVICQLYAADRITREELVERLVHYPYAKEGETDGYDWLAVNPPGTWSEITLAIEMGLVDEDIYEEVFNRRHAN